MSSHAFLFRTSLLLFAATCIAVGATATTTTSESLVRNGVTRTYRLHVPASYTVGSNVPLVLAFHYLAGSGALMESLTQFSPLADAQGFIVAYPDGLSGQWDIGQSSYSADDVGYVSQLIDTLTSNYSIDAARVYATGMSNGGYFTHLLGIELPGRFAALAPVAGGMLDSLPTPTSPMPVLMMRGTADTVVPFAGGTGQLSATAITDRWVATDGCVITPTTVAIPDSDPTDGCTAARATYPGGLLGSEVVFYVITGGGHAWPGHELPRNFGPSCKDFDATAVVWTFFSGHARASSGGSTTGTTTGSSGTGSSTSGSTSSTTAGATAGSASSGTGDGGGAGGGHSGGCGVGAGFALLLMITALSARLAPPHRQVKP